MVTEIISVVNQDNRHALFGTIDLDCTVNYRFRHTVVFVEEEYIEWRSAIMFGICYFLEHIDQKIGLYQGRQNRIAGGRGKQHCCVLPDRYGPNKSYRLHIKT